MGLVDLAREVTESKKVNLRAVFDPYGWQKELLDAVERFLIPIIGRQAGKTMVAGQLAIERAWKKTGFYMVVVPTHKQGGNSFRYIMDAIRPHKNEIYQSHTGSAEGKSERIIHLKNGSVIQWFSADNPESLAGYTAHGVLFDEFADIKEEAWNIVRPTLSVHKGWCLFVTTPEGKGNMSYKFWLRGMSKNPKYKDWRAWGYRAGDKSGPKEFWPYDRGLWSGVSPYHSEEEINFEREDMPEMKFIQEVGACFLDDAGRALKIPADTWYNDVWRDGPVKGEGYVAGVDIGKKMDYTVVTIMNDRGQVRHVYRWYGWDHVTGAKKIKEILEKWNAMGLVDTTGVGDAVFDILLDIDANVQPYELYTNTQKALLIERLMHGLENNHIKLDDPEKHQELSYVRDEMEIFGYTRTVFGNMIYSAPEGEHDDCVDSLALAYYLIWAAGSVKGFADLEEKETII